MRLTCCFSLARHSLSQRCCSCFSFTWSFCTSSTSSFFLSKLFFSTSSFFLSILLCFSCSWTTVTGLIFHLSLFRKEATDTVVWLNVIKISIYLTRVSCDSYQTHLEGREGSELRSFSLLEKEFLDFMAAVLEGYSSLHNKEKTPDQTLVTTCTT